MYSYQVKVTSKRKTQNAILKSWEFPDNETLSSIFQCKQILKQDLSSWELLNPAYSYCSDKLIVSDVERVHLPLIRTESIVVCKVREHDRAIIARAELPVNSWAAVNSYKLNEAANQLDYGWLAGPYVFRNAGWWHGVNVWTIAHDPSEFYMVMPVEQWYREAAKQRNTIARKVFSW